MSWCLPFLPKNELKHFNFVWPLKCWNISYQVIRIVLCLRKENLKSFLYSVDIGKKICEKHNFLRHEKLMRNSSFYREKERVSAKIWTSFLISLSLSLTLACFPFLGVRPSKVNYCSVYFLNENTIMQKSLYRTVLMWLNN